MRLAPVWRLPITRSLFRLPTLTSSRAYSSTKTMSDYAVSDEDGAYSLGDSDVEMMPVKKASSNVAAKKNASKLADRPVEEVYQKKTQLEHILLRPDTYIGSVERQTQMMWVYDEAGECMVQKSLSFVPGLFKIFDEILVNAADNKIRDPEGMDTLKVDIDKENGSIAVFNNGRGIPVEMHKTEGVYVPELIFGHLLTSSNYNDAEKKVTGGRNGYGAKLCNIFSTEFIIETADRRKGLQYRQVFSQNMSKKGAPKITKWNGSGDFTRITFKPDFNKFGMEGFEADTEALFKKRVYDMSGCTPNVKVFLNGTRLKVKNFKQYVELYLKKPADPNALTPAPTPTLIHERVNDRWEICCAVSDGQFQQVSFVNSINTYKGGTHVEHVSGQIVSALVEAVKKKSKEMASIKPFQVKSHLNLFINCLVENPTFDSQTKENMTLRQGAFGSKCEVGDDFMKKVLKSGVLENIMTWARFKQDQALKKTDGAKRSRLSGIAKLDDANNAGTKNGQRCTLILTEGDSAKALAVSGLSVVGRDNYGVFPLRGKLLNVREASAAQIGANAEITNIKQILGLQQNKEYTSTESLRYGHLMIMTDQDHDGSHIKGLLINFLDHFWPSLLRIPGFLTEFITPIVKATRGRQEIAFYTIPQYERWKADHDDGRGWTIKYYKGLGTSTAADAKRYFQDMDTHKKVFSASTPEDRQLVDMAFNKKRADERKEWLKTCTPDTFLDHAASETVHINDFINKELILFSQADNVRSIPSMVDGLKPGQRKIMFACFKRKLKGELKVMQLAGYVSEHAAYHHGEQSLCQTIVGLAQNFVGSNNLNLLEPNGQFGTRLQGGKDAASPRYIFTALSPFARAVFRPDDDALLRYLTDDGQSIEPEWYMPVLPMVLVNGCEGIGTGWSTTIPSYNPADIVANLTRLMDGQEPVEMHPWYSGFAGSIVQESTNKYRVTGTWRKVDDCTLEITELPVGSWTQSYKEFLEGLLAAEGAAGLGLRDYKEHHTDATVRFTLTLTAQGMADAEREGVEKRFRLAGSINTGNMVCFDPSGRIRKYGGPDQILQDFFDARLTFYQRRKDHLSAELTREWTILDNKVRFIREIIDGLLVVQNRPKATIEADLRSRNYEPNNSTLEENTDQETTSSSSSYDYLLRMPIYTLTKERVEQLEHDRAQTNARLEDLLSRSPKDLWRADLAEFMALWNDREAAKAGSISAQRSAVAVAGGQGKKKGGSSKGTAAGKKVATAATALVAAKRVSIDESEEEEEEYVPKAKAKPSVSTSKKTKTTLDAFVKRAPPAPTPAPVIMLSDDDEEDLNNLPLAVRISRMLARSNTAAKSSSGQASVPSVVKPTQPAVPVKVDTAETAKPAAKTKAPLQIISDSEEDGDAYAVSDDDDDDAYEDSE